MTQRKKTQTTQKQNAPTEIASSGSPEPRVTFEYVRVDDLIPYARNSRTHSPEQISQIAASLKEFGFIAPVVIDKENGIIAGHGRILAAQKLGLTEVPAVRAEHLSDAQRRAYVIVDNRLAETSSWDKEMLTLELGEIASLAPEIDLGSVGFSEPELHSMELTLGALAEEAGAPGTAEKEELELYTKKVKAPIYTPTGEKPPLAALWDKSKTEKLLEAIEASTVPEEEKVFLREAAQRHTVFNYEAIAEYYCHADKETQELMESSALVIIDFQKAIEHGFVTLSQELAEAYADET